MKNQALFPMKNLILASFLFSLSGAALAQDYYTPVKKELEPMARFALKSFTLNDQAISYELPLDLTGQAIRVDMQRTPGPMEGLRLYTGDLGTASCMGSDLLPACVMQHKNLPINPSALNQLIDKKYLDPQLRTMARDVATSFSSGNEPIGFISRRVLQTVPPLPTQWQSYFTGQSAGQPFKIENVRMRFENGRGTFTLPNGIEGTLTEVFVDNSHVSAYWQTPGESGWIDLQLSTDRQQFVGTWGREVGQAAAGKWNGQAAP